MQTVYGGHNAEEGNNQTVSKGTQFVEWENDEAGDSGGSSMKPFEKARQHSAKSACRREDANGQTPMVMNE